MLIALFIFALLYLVCCLLHIGSKHSDDECAEESATFWNEWALTCGAVMAILGIVVFAS